MYLDVRTQPNNMINAANFGLVYRYLVKARIDAVYSAFSGRRPPQYIPIPKFFAVLKSLAHVANSIGRQHLGQNGTLKFVLAPEDDPADRAHRITNLVTHNILESFADLVTAVHLYAALFEQDTYPLPLPELLGGFQLLERHSTSPT